MAIIVLTLMQKFISYKLAFQDVEYEVYFVMYKQIITDDNIVILEYIVTNKDVSNSASSFTLSAILTFQM